GAFDRYSMARKAARVSADRPSGSAAWIEKRPSVAAIVNAYTRRIRPAVTVMAPGISRRLDVARTPPFREINRCAKIVATAPIGTFTNTPARHPNGAVRPPSAIEPAANPADRIETRTPNARFLSPPSGKVAARIAKAVAVVIAAAIP